MGRTSSDCPLFPTNGNQLVTLSKEDTVSQALKTLSDARISSAPVLDEEGRAVYILTVADIVNHILRFVSEEELKTGKITGILQNREQLAQHKLRDISRDMAELDKPFSIFGKEPLFKVAQLMTQHNAHRILTIDEQDKPRTLISQSHLVRLLSNITDDKKLHQSVEELQLGTEGVISIHRNKTALEAFKLMAEKKVTGLAVVTNEGSLVGNISMSDIKAIGHNLESVDYLTSPISHFLEKVRQMDEPVGNKPQVIKCHVTSSLYSVLSLLGVYRVHRVLVVDDNDKPIRVIATVDLLKLLCEQYQTVQSM